MYDLIIVGGGPAGAAAAVYAARKKLKTHFITHEWGGQSIVSPDIQNWIGEKSISGNELAKKLREHVEQYKSDCLNIVAPAKAAGVEVSGEKITVRTEDGQTFESRTLLICSGADRRKLKVPGAKEYDQKGLTYCASCDGPLFTDKDVVVIGGGNAGFETAAQLLAYTKSVTLLNRGPEFKADKITVDKVLSHPNMKALKNTEPTEVFGEVMVKGIKHKNIETGEEGDLAVEGVFVEIGLVPNTGWIGDALELDKYNRIIIDQATQKTSHENIWAAGDVADGLYHQNNIAAGDAVKALEDIYVTLHAK